MAACALFLDEMEDLLNVDTDPRWREMVVVVTHNGVVESIYGLRSG